MRSDGLLSAKREAKREYGTPSGKSIAVPATVSGKCRPYATGFYTWEGGRSVTICKPGDLPSQKESSSSGGYPGQGANWLAYGSSSPSCTDDLCEHASADKSVDSLAEVTILVCNTCRLKTEPHLDPRPGSVLAQNTITAGSKAGVNVRSVGCLGNCKRGLSAAILRKGSWSYVFGELDPDSADDLISGARIFASSSNGLMPFRERPESLKRGLVARIPTFDSLKDLP